MAKKDNSEKLPVKEIGKIGNLRVVEITAGFPLIEIGSVRLGARKVKAVLENIETCKAFVAKYDVAKDDNKAASAALKIQQLEAAKAELEAKLAKFAPAPTTPTRIDPLQKAA